MKNKYNYERIPRRAECLQWDGKNTDEILGFLAKNSIIGELYRGNEYILIKQDGCIATSIRHGIWILKGEDGVIRYYSDSQHKLMYRPISDELERLRAFAREILDRDRGDDIGGDELQELGEKYGMLELHFPIAPCGELCSCADVYHFIEFDHGTVKCYRLAGSLKAHE